MKRRGSIAVDLGFLLFGALVIGFEYASNAKGFAIAGLLGGFVAYLIIFDDDSSRRHGTLARMIVGALVGIITDRSVANTSDSFPCTSSFLAGSPQPVVSPSTRPDEARRPCLPLRE